MTSLPLAILGFVTVIVMLILIMTKKASPLVALIAVPVVTGIIACFFIAGGGREEPGVVDFITNFKSLGDMITGSKGIGSVAATGVMFIFSILFFGILTDAGTFRPIIGHSEPGRHRSRQNRHRHRHSGCHRPSGRLRRGHLPDLCARAASSV